METWAELDPLHLSSFENRIADFLFYFPSAPAPCPTGAPGHSSILQKMRYLKDQVMWSNTMLWDMFIPIFKLLTLKLSNHWIAQFYEVISLNFRLIKYSDAWKLTFFSLKISWNDFKVKYAWIEVKKCLQIEFGVNGAIEWGFRGV